MHPHWKYPNLTLLIISLLVTILLLLNGHIEQLTNVLNNLGYIGVLFTGMLFVSTFTVAPAAVVLFEFSRSLDPLLVALVGGAGATFGDYIAYRFIRDRLFAELSPILKMFHLYRRVDILHTKYFAWLAPVIGAAIIASPFPDEIGLSLLGLKRIKPIMFLVLAFFLNSIGIFIIALAAQSGS